MTLQELRFLIALANEKHFGKAARLCHVSQPTLSIAIQKLEKELKIALFERNKNDVHLTPLGEEVVEYAQRIIADVNELKQVALKNQDQLSSPLKLGVIYTVGPYLLPSLISELNKSTPRLALEIEEDFTANLKDKLLAGNQDAIIVALPFNNPGIVSRQLYKEPFVVLMPSDHPLADKKVIPEKLLNDYTVLMLGEGHCFRDQIISSCPACFVSTTQSNVNLQTVAGSSLETIKHMVAAKMGISVLPATAAFLGPYRGNLLTTRLLKGSQAERSIVLAWRKTYPRFKAIEALLTAISRCKLEGLSSKKFLE